MSSHAWISKVLKDIETYAQMNDLRQTADAIVAARRIADAEAVVRPDAGGNLPGSLTGFGV